ncbi:hypothetical protein BDQ17DRAFT_1252957 [Cyathus striatus]|nr:hypothetical protein BDQ17DRAFT_1252957 [Cyathus striatus]
MRGFHADDEEKGESKDAVSPDASSLPQGGSSTPSTKKSRQKKKKKQEEQNLTPSTNPTILERLKPALVLENSGSTARDHLASERTFLAYVRTSLALAGTGVGDPCPVIYISDLASQRYDLPTTAKHLQQFSRPLGTTTILFAIIVLLIGLTRYFTVQTSLIRGTFPTARSSIVFITIVLLMITIIVFVVLLVGRKG